eukprot:TRINITY_DN24058_c0_g1_i4.p1 TRINITY_DN24058_c0_g1~~TRINITY_DN24058_c0_g1_i4.p1  ORF type:complete len:190 (+),score=76.85 TRINITY_DN24058_c0_g1_i4:178-747(+)
MCIRDSPNEWETIVTPASAWEMNKELGAASECAQEASLRVKRAESALVDEMEAIRQAFDQAEEETGELERASAAAAAKAEAARTRLEEMRRCVVEEEQELTQQLEQAKDAEESAHQEYQEVRAKCDRFAKAIDTSRDSASMDEDHVLREQYRHVARVQRDNFYGPPGASPHSNPGLYRPPGRVGYWAKP